MMNDAAVSVRPLQHNSASVARPQRTLSIQILVSNPKTAIVYASVFAAFLERWGNTRNR
jgi:hypothetical protein